MDILDKLKSQIGDDVQHIFDHEALFKAACDEITALRARLEAANEGLTAAYLAGVADEKARQAEALATARRDAYERSAQVAETAKAVCARCNSPEDNHPYRHPFVPVVMINIPAAIRALANEAET